MIISCYLLVILLVFIPIIPCKSNLSLTTLLDIIMILKNAAVCKSEILF